MTYRAAAADASTSRRVVITYFALLAGSRGSWRLDAGWGAFVISEGLAAKYPCVHWKYPELRRGGTGYASAAAIPRSNSVPFTLGTTPIHARLFSSRIGPRSSESCRCGGSRRSVQFACNITCRGGGGKSLSVLVPFPSRVEYPGGDGRRAVAPPVSRQKNGLAERCGTWSVNGRRRRRDNSDFCPTYFCPDSSVRLFSAKLTRGRRSA